ncbi:MAG: class I SAM-dependent DNA methyltransferase [Ilumatobacter sp.]|uniref:class I SAM-dependent DNA methyltransferase n=1 Tax=Ilumatobacter sp. TaxID=1967498 RepID=UPI00391C01C6
MPEGRAVTSVSDSYDRMAQQYVDHVGRELQYPSLDRAALRLFAELVGPGANTLDAGCGPGHVTAFLAATGSSISGIDISPAMIELARSSFPEIDFRIGRLTDLSVDRGSVQGVVSRHSIIHTDPRDLDEVVSEFARVLAPGGRLFVSFFAVPDGGHHGQPFDHAVCTAYQLDTSAVSELLASHGLDEEIRLLRQPCADERRIPHATLIARRVDRD